VQQITKIHSTAFADDGLDVSQAMKNMRRASSVSILSGLGVKDPEAILEPTSPTQAEVPPDTPTLSQPQTPEPPALPPKSQQGSVRTFPGRRPPSELVTNHLGAFFPGADRKVIERARRMSMLRPQGLGKRDSIASFATGGRPNPRFSRISVSTQGSGGVRPGSPRGSTISGISGISAGDGAPRVSLSTEDGRSVDLQPAYNLPPLPAPGEGLGLAAELQASFEGRSSSRQSMYSQYKTKRDKDRSDAASMLTVDEITAEVAEVESRRTSTLIGSEAGDEWTKVSVSGETEEMATPDEPESCEEEEEEEEEDWAEGSRWVKGALIGAGAFGQVYLGMDAETGVLMAVKQVELPKDNTPNAERKKAMLTALEHEIALLQELRHQNIVQYLHSALDEEYLNIFLEYVPGGSVTSLLQNYGAFEETLVKTFLRQILRGLEYLHAKDIIHRDIKGANILIDNKGTVKISDFGISKKGGGGESAAISHHRQSLTLPQLLRPPEASGPRSRAPYSGWPPRL
jgi:mitogen-activated protein kinase kinase kinase